MDEFSLDLLCYPEKFDIALKLGPLRRNLNEYRDNCDIAKSFRLRYNQPDHYLLPGILKDVSISSLRVTSSFQAEALKELWLPMSLSCQRDHLKDNAQLNKVLNAWTQFCKINVNYTFSCFPNEVASQINDEWLAEHENVRFDKGMMHGLALYSLSRQLINQHKELSKACTEWMKQPYPKPKLNPVFIALDGKYSYIKMGWDVGILKIDKDVFLLDRDSFLLLVNKIGELSCAIWYSISQRILFNGEGYSKLKKFLSIACQPIIRSTQRNGDENQDGFKFTKALEAIGVGVIIEKEDGRRHWDNNIFIESTLQGLIEERVISGDSYENTAIYQFFDSLTTPEISELIGCVKLVGHPDIEFDEGLKTLYDRTHEDIHVDPLIIEETRGLLTYEFIQRYFQRNRTWPPLEVPDSLEFVYLKQSIQQSISPLSESFVNNCKLDWVQWNRVRINECVEFDYWESPLEFIKDTALSPNRQEILEYCFQHKLHPTTNFQSTVKEKVIPKNYALEESNRLIIQFLLSPTFYQRSLNYRKNWATNPDWDSVLYESRNYMLIKMTSKEREQKAGGRYFGASPYPERDRRIQVEGEVASLMQQYFPEQMLTATALEFNQKLIRFRNYRKLYPEHHVVQLCFDFSAWNNYMRKEFIDQGVGEVLNGIFNTYSYGRIMQFYNHAILYADTPLTLVTWLGQEGGIEGLNQATWTLATLMGLKVALSHLGYKFEISVKGDDCRAAILIPKKEILLPDLHGEISRIKDALTDYCQRTGMRLKPEETFESLCLIASSKQYQIDDIILPCGIKQALKMAHHTNAAFPTSQDIVSDIMSSCHSACYNTPFVITTWCIGVLISLMRLLHDYTILRDLNYQQITTLALWPQILGGPGMLPLEVFIVRGENDMLSLTLSIYAFILQTYPSDHEISSIIWSILTIPDADKHSWRLLLSDCYSLNRKHPLSPQQFLKSQLREKIKEITRNPMIRILFQTEYEEAEKILIDILLSMDPLNLKIAVAIYENSAFSILNKILTRIDNASSVFMLLGSKKGIVLSRVGMAILRRASRIHQRQIKWWIQVLKEPNGGLSSPGDFYGLTLQEFKQNCPTVMAQYARQQSWGKPIFGITYPSLTRQFYLIPSNRNMGVQYLLNIKPNCGSYLIDNPHTLIPQTDHPHPYFQAPPNASPWIGGKTDTKARLPGAPRLHKSESLPKIRNLLEVAARCASFAPALIPVIKWCVNMMVFLTNEEFDLILPDITGGSSAHRVKIMSFSQTVTANYRHNILQPIHHNYDRMQFTHSALHLDYNLNFLAMFVHHAFILTYNWMFKYPTNQAIPLKFDMLIHQKGTTFTPEIFDPCEGCLADVGDRFIQVPDFHLPDISLQGSLLVVLPDQDIMELHQSLSILKQQRTLHIMAQLNTSLQGGALYRRQAHYAILNKMLVDSRKYNENLTHIAPGAIFSQAVIQAFGADYSPIPLKFLFWMDPLIAAEELLDMARIELISLYPYDQLIDRTEDIIFPRGPRNNLLPIINLYIKAGNLANLAMALNQIQRTKRLGNPLIGIELMQPESTCQWMFTCALISIRRDAALNQPLKIHIVTTHNVAMSELLEGVGSRLDGVLTSFRGRCWQVYYPDPRGLFHKEFPHAQSPCPNWCANKDEFFNWLTDKLNLDWDRPPVKWLLRAVYFPIGLMSNITTEQQLMRAYQNNNPTAGFTWVTPQTYLWRTNAETLNSVSKFLGFPMIPFLTGTCHPGSQNVLEDWIELWDEVTADFLHLEANNDRAIISLTARWRTKGESLCTLEIDHMEEEAAMADLMINPYSDSTIIAQLQERLQNPPILPVAHYFQINLGTPRLPNGLRATLLDIAIIDLNDLDDIQDIRENWLNVNQHFRIKGYSGTASAKLREMLTSLGIIGVRIQGGVAVCLADGQGGFATLLGLLYPNLEIYHNTLQGVDATPGEIPGDWLANIMSLDKIHSGMSYPGDLCDPREVKIMSSYIHLHLNQLKTTIITFDGEYYGDHKLPDYLLMLENIVILMGEVAGNDTVIIIKLFLYPGVLLSTPVQYLIDTSVQFNLVKLLSSRENNREIYLVMTGITYPWNQFRGLHKRKYQYFLQSINRIITQHNIQTRPRWGLIFHELMNSIHSRHPCYYKSKQYEHLLNLPHGSLTHKRLWNDNLMVDRLKYYLNSSTLSLRARSRHLMSQGRRSVGLGGIQRVLLWTRQLLRLTPCIIILEDVGGNMPMNTQSFQDYFRKVHHLMLRARLNQSYTEVHNLLQLTDYWTSCVEHPNCITSTNSLVPWTSEAIHLDEIHEFGTGADVGIRLTTIGAIILHDPPQYDILDEIITQ